MHIWSSRLTAFAVTLACAAPGSAQSQGSSDPAPIPTLAQELTSAPVPGQRGISLTAGFELAEGRTETRGWSLDGIVAHTTRKKQLIRIDAEVKTGRYRPEHVAEFFLVEDNQFVSGTVLHPVRPRVSLVGIGGWRRDKVLGLEQRLWVEGGVGFHMVEHRRANLLIAPTFAVGKERRTHTDRANGVRDFGILQSFVGRLTPTVSVEEFLQAHVDTSDTTDRQVTFNMSAIAKLATHVNVKLFYKHQYDALPPPGTDPDQRSVGLAIEIAFNRAGAVKPAP